MKYYGDYKNASISMAEDPLLKEELMALANSDDIEVIIESGTYIGLGSTLMLANAFLNSRSLKIFYTLEVNNSFWKTAKRNLKRFKFIKCLHGCSLDLNESIEFVKSDYAILNHKDYPNQFIDDINDPVKFYVNELNGHLNSLVPVGIKKYLKFSRKDGLLKKLISKHKNQKKLFVLDSAGGVGFLEFKKIIELNKDSSFYILLDDIHHLKHFRSKEYIMSDKKFNIINYSEINGWLLAKYKI